MPWVKQIVITATFVRWRKICSGMIGFFTSLTWVTINTPNIRAPKMIRQITVVDFHGNMVPPNSSPKRNIRVNPKIVALPVQSIAFKPSNIGVRGL